MTVPDSPAMNTYVTLASKDGRIITINLSAVDAIEEQHDTDPTAAVYLRGGAVFYIAAPYRHVIRAFTDPFEGGTNDSS